MPFRCCLPKPENVLVQQNLNKILPGPPLWLMTGLSELLVLFAAAGGGLLLQSKGTCSEDDDSCEEASFCFSWFSTKCAALERTSRADSMIIVT